MKTYLINTQNVNTVEIIPKLEENDRNYCPNAIQCHVDLWIIQETSNWITYITILCYLVIKPYSDGVSGDKIIF